MGAWEEIVDYTVPSNTTSVTLNNFGTITKDDFIRVTGTFVNASNTGCIYRLYPNNQTTDTDYTRQLVVGPGSNVVAVRGNLNLFAWANFNKTSSSNTYIKLSENNKYNMFANHNDEIDSGVVNGFTYTTTPNLTFSSGITSLTLNTSETNGLGAGSRIQIYRLAAEKVADIVISSNTTRVDITGLDIQKGSEYLLVSDVKAANSGINQFIYVNNNLNNSNSYRQMIRGNGSTADAFRQNTAVAIDYNNSSTHGITYGFIKLSNIGAYTSQNYGFTEMTSNMILQNNFISSTFENLTSINQINLFIGGFGAASGSRFQLYKLY